MTLAVSFMYIIIAMKTVSFRPLLQIHPDISQNSIQPKLLPIKKAYRCRHISTSISDDITTVGSNGKI